jgi:hypothetical protein
MEKQDIRPIRHAATASPGSTDIIDRQAAARDQRPNPIREHLIRSLVPGVR